MRTHHHEPRDVTTIGALRSQKFTIAANAKAFSVLVGDLYSDTIRAAIRELWSNAMDSHAEAGYPERPFDCHLPSIFEPEFKVRDYGVSMDEETVMSLYTTIFESTKEDTDEQVGKFGLGSKSPFGYTDSFTVTTWLAGERCVYSAYLGADRAPNIDLLDRSPSTDPTGVEVSFPVQTHDIDSFARKAGVVARGFDILPTLTVGQSEGEAFHQAREVKKLAEGKGWYLFASDDYYAKAQARQGCVLYPIEARSIDLCSPDVRVLLESNVVIDFPIGDVDIQPSREGLQYDETTQANIVARCQEISDEFVEQVKARFADVSTLWEATLRYNEIAADESLNSTIQKILGHKLKFRGKALSKRIALNRHHQLFFHGRMMKVDRRQALHGLTYRHSKAWEGKWTSDMPGHVDPGEDIFYIDEIENNVSNRGVGAKIAYHFKRMMSGDGSTTRIGRMVWVKVRKGTDDFKRLMVMLGRPDESAFIFADTLDEVPKHARASSSRTKVFCKAFKVIGDGGSWYDDGDVAIEDDNIIYIQTLRGDVCDSVIKYNWGDNMYAKAMRYLISTRRLPADAKLVLIPGTHRKKVDRAGSNWKNFGETMKAAVTEDLTPELVQLLNDQMSIAQSAKSGRLLQAYTEHNRLPACRDGAIWDAAARARVIDRRLDRIGDTEHLFEFASRLSVPTMLSDHTYDASRVIFDDDAVERLDMVLNSEFPMLRYALTGYGDEDRAFHMMDYVDLVMPG